MTCPRSLIFSVEKINHHLGRLSKFYKQASSSNKKKIGLMYKNIRSLNADKITEIGLHEFLKSFIEEINLVYKKFEQKYFFWFRSMKIKIAHSTTYKYSSTVPRLIQCLKLYPSIYLIIKEILEWETSSSSGKIVESHIDGLGHRVQKIFLLIILVESFRITSKGVLKTKDLSGVVKGLKEKVNPLCFLRETDLTKPCEKIEKISNEAKKNIKNVIEFIHKIKFSSFRFY